MTKPQLPAQRKSSQHSQSRRPSLQKQELPRATTHNDYDAAAFFRDYAFSTQPLRPLYPAYFPAAQASREPNASILPDNAARTTPPSNAPREPRALRQTNPFRGGSKKSRAYPELQIETQPKPPQNKYQQAMSCVDGVVRKTSSTLVMLPKDTGAGQQILKLSPKQGPAKMPPPSPILQELQSNREGGYFPLKPGLRGIIPPHETVAVMQSTWTTEQNSHSKKSISQSSSEQDLIEAMQGLKLFGGMRPASDEPQVPPLDVAKLQADDPVVTKPTRINTEVAREALSEGARHDIASQRSLHRDHKGMHNTETPDKAVKNAAVITENVSHADPTSHKLPDHPVEQDATRTTESPPVTSAYPSNATDALAQPMGNQEDTSQKPKLHTNVDNGLDSEAEEAIFEDIPLDSPIAASPTPSAPSTGSDENFEVVATNKYQTRRNGRMGIWERWVHGKP